MWGDPSRASHRAIGCICLILYGCGLIASGINFRGSLRHIYGVRVRPQKTRAKITPVSLLPLSFTRPARSSIRRNYHLRGGHESPLSSASADTYYRHHHHPSNTNNNLRYKSFPPASPDRGRRQVPISGRPSASLSSIYTQIRTVPRRPADGLQARGGAAAADPLY